VAGLRHPQEFTDAAPQQVDDDVTVVQDAAQDGPIGWATPESPESPADATALLDTEPADTDQDLESSRSADPAAKPKPTGKIARQYSPKPRPVEPAPTETSADVEAVRSSRRPRAKRGLRAWVPVLAADDATEDETDHEEVATGGRWRRSPLFVPAVLATATVLFGGLATWFGLEANSSNGAAANSALVDTATTSEVNGQISDAVSKIFSYRYTDIAATQQAAQNLLTGKALCQYNNLMKVVAEQAPQQKLVLRATVVEHGVTILQGDKANVLIFLNQRDVRTTDNQSTSAGAQLAVQAVRQGGSWKISNIDTFRPDASTSHC